MYEKEIELLQKIIDESGNIVFFGGAGVSTESNIPDFRSADGIYHQKYKYSPEQVVSHSFFHGVYRNILRLLQGKNDDIRCVAQPCASQTGRAGKGGEADGCDYTEY